MAVRPSPRGLGNTWQSDLAKADESRELAIFALKEWCFRQRCHARIAVWYETPGIGYPHSPTGWDCRIWDQHFEPLVKWTANFILHADETDRCPYEQLILPLLGRMSMPNDVVQLYAGGEAIPPCFAKFLLSHGQTPFHLRNCNGEMEHYIQSWLPPYSVADLLQLAAFESMAAADLQRLALHATQMTLEQAKVLEVMMHLQNYGR